jgi:hypothetical protein
MFGLDHLETLFAASAFLLQLVLISHFAIRKWRFSMAIRFGWLVYALGIPAAAASVILLRGGKPWWLWVGGFIFLAWAVCGYLVEYVKDIQWRSPIHWKIFGPYVSLYLATVMFYWWPLALLWKPLWYIYAVLFVTSTILNVTSHKGAQDQKPLTEDVQ